MAYRTRNRGTEERWKLGMDRSHQAMLDDGFTLTEVLVAFAILSLSVILGLRAFGSGALQVAHVEEEFSKLHSMTETLAAVQLGEPTSQAPENPDVVTIPLAGEKSDWSSLIPQVVVITNPDSKSDPIETILVRPMNDE